MIIGLLRCPDRDCPATEPPGLRQPAPTPDMRCGNCFRRCSATLPRSLPTFDLSGTRMPGGGTAKDTGCVPPDIPVTTRKLLADFAFEVPHRFGLYNGFELDNAGGIVAPPVAIAGTGLASPEAATHRDRRKSTCASLFRKALSRKSPRKSPHLPGQPFRIRVFFRFRPRASQPLGHIGKTYPAGYRREIRTYSIYEQPTNSPGTGPMPGKTGTITILSAHRRNRQCRRGGRLRRPAPSAATARRSPVPPPGRRSTPRPIA